MRRVMGVWLAVGLLLGLAACGKQAPSQETEAKFLAAQRARTVRRASSTTVLGATTTIPATTTTMPPLQRLALSRAFLEAAEAQRVAQERCVQLGTGC